MDDKALSEVMRELGKRSAAARKAKQGDNFMKELVQQGAAARRGSGKKQSEPLKEKKIGTVKKQKEVKKGELPDSMQAFADKLAKRAKENKDDMLY